MTEHERQREWRNANDELTHKTYLIFLCNGRRCRLNRGDMLSDEIEEGELEADESMTDKWKEHAEKEKEATTLFTAHNEKCVQTDEDLIYYDAWNS